MTADFDPSRSARAEPGLSVVFDLGGVLIDWDPRYVYRTLFAGDDAAMEAFLRDVCSPDWNLCQDAGRSWAEATALLRAEHPQHAALIDAYHHRWADMLAGPIEGTVQILRELKAAGVPVFALTNWSHETFPIARARYDFLTWFHAIVVSGEERLVKPDPAIYRLLCARHDLRPGGLVYIDDNAANVDAAAALGMHAIRFTDPASLRAALLRLGLPVRPAESDEKPVASSPGAVQQSERTENTVAATSRSVAMQTPAARAS